MSARGLKAFDILKYLKCVYTLDTRYSFMSNQMSVYTEPYTEFVMEMLVGIKGKSKSDVANFILKEWISDHMDELKEYGITVEKARKEKILR